VVLEKAGEDHLHWSCEEWRVAKSQGGEKHPVYNTTMEG